ncbi:hypothetical protein KBA73_01355 [Patescibacteria group bacterium]|nr:hypothetical protein [Patescibacteria group bacterium]
MSEKLTLTTVDKMPAELFEDPEVQEVALARLNRLLAEGNESIHEIDEAPDALLDVYESFRSSPEIHEAAVQGLVRSMENGFWLEARTIFAYLRRFTDEELEREDIQEFGRTVLVPEILKGDYFCIEIGKQMQLRNKSVERAMIKAAANAVETSGRSIEHVSGEMRLSAESLQAPALQEAAKKSVMRALSEGHWRIAESLFERFKLRPEHALGPEMFEAATEGLVKILSLRDSNQAIYSAFEFIKSYGLESILSSPMVQTVLKGHKRHGDMMKRSEFRKYLNAEE